MLRILIADDDTQLGRALELYLESLGFESIVCNSADAVRSLTESKDLSFDFALVDYQFGEDCGAEMSQWLLDRFPKLRLVLMSGYPEDSMMQVDSFGPRAMFLQKPFHPGDVISCLRALNPMLAMQM